MLKEYLSALANAFRLKLGTAEKINAQDFPDKVTEVYNAGYEKGKAEGGTDSYYDTFWDNYQSNGIRNHWVNAFSQQGWSDMLFKPKYPINDIQYCWGMFTQSIITDTKISLDFTNYVSGQEVFAYCRNLKTIRTLIVNSKVNFNSWFIGCAALQNITFEGEIGNDISFAQSNLLTHDSLISIINHLGTVTTTKILTLHADSKAKLTDAEKAIATEKGWTIA